EFCFDFICNSFPRSVGTARVYMSAPHVPEVFDSLKRCLDQYRQKLIQQQIQQQQQQITPPAPPPEEPGFEEPREESEP
ncbi:MAG: hypothetical protein JSS02_15625, partial [Planctomycetes bacterium]|nr:hypothetical protein [Planctomycetota bacterium]